MLSSDNLINIKPFNRHQFIYDLLYFKRKTKSNRSTDQQWSGGTGGTGGTGGGTGGVVITIKTIMQFTSGATVVSLFKLQTIYIYLVIFVWMSIRVIEKNKNEMCE